MFVRLSLCLCASEAFEKKKSTVVFAQTICSTHTSKLSWLKTSAPFLSFPLSSSHPNETDIFNMSLLWLFNTTPISFVVVAAAVVSFTKNFNKKIRSFSIKLFASKLCKWKNSLCLSRSHLIKLNVYSNVEFQAPTFFPDPFRFIFSWAACHHCNIESKTMQ